MIRITDSRGQQVHLAPAAIAQVTEAGASSQWHGVRSFVKTFDGKTIEASERADEIAAQVAKASGAAA